MITEPSTRATFLLPPHDPPRGGDEPGMRHHAVGGAHTEAVDVPGTQERLDGLDAGEATVRAQRLHRLLRLGHGGHIGSPDPAGAQRLARVWDDAPGLRQVQEESVHRTIRDPRIDVERPQDQVLHWAEQALDVPHRLPGKVLPYLVGDDPASGADRAQQRHCQRARPRSRLEDRRARVDVAPEQQHAEVLRVDHLRAAGHLQDELGQGGTQDEEALPAGRLHADPFLLTDQGIEREFAAAQVVEAPGLEDDKIAAAPSVEEENGLTLHQRPRPRPQVLTPRGVTCSRTQSTICCSEVPGVKISAMPAVRSGAMSSSGIIPPAKTTMSSAPRSRRNWMIRGKRALCAPERMERPIASTSSWIALFTIISGVWCRPV